VQSIGFHRAGNARSTFGEGFVMRTASAELICSFGTAGCVSRRVHRDAASGGNLACSSRWELEALLSSRLSAKCLPILSLVFDDFGRPGARRILSATGERAVLDAGADAFCSFLLRLGLRAAPGACANVVYRDRRCDRPSTVVFVNVRMSSNSNRFRSSKSQSCSSPPCTRARICAPLSAP